MFLKIYAGITLNKKKIEKSVRDTFKGKVPNQGQKNNFQ